jgi:DNA-binding HxlR family transcriptional regulator
MNRFEVMELEMPMKLYASPADASFGQVTGGTTEEAAREKNVSLMAWNLLGKRWIFLILTELLARPQSFQELLNHIEGISEKVLAERLKELECEGMLRREKACGGHVRVMYCLTAKGEALEPVIRALWVWSQCY